MKCDWENGGKVGRAWTLEGAGDTDWRLSGIGYEEMRTGVNRLKGTERGPMISQDSFFMLSIP